MARELFTKVATGAPPDDDDDYKRVTVNDNDNDDKTNDDNANSVNNNDEGDGEDEEDEEEVVVVVEEEAGEAREKSSGTIMVRVEYRNVWKTLAMEEEASVQQLLDKARTTLAVALRRENAPLDALAVWLPKPLGPRWLADADSLASCGFAPSDTTELPPRVCLGVPLHQPNGCPSRCSLVLPALANLILFFWLERIY
jgi:hypothetical protein